MNYGYVYCLTNKYMPNMLNKYLFHINFIFIIIDH